MTQMAINTPIIGIIGNKFNGKDTIANYIVEKYKYRKIAFADKLKQACKLLYNLTDDQLYGDKKEIIDPNWGTTPRIIMQHVGTLFRENMKTICPKIGNNFWVQIVKNECRKSPVVISDVRFKNEVQMIKDLYGVLIKVERPGIKCSDIHESEQELHSIDPDDIDYRIINDGDIESLYRKIDHILLFEYY